MRGANVVKTPYDVEHHINNKILLYYSKGYILDYKYNIQILEFKYLNIIYRYDIST